MTKLRLGELDYKVQKKLTAMLPMGAMFQTAEYVNRKRDKHKRTSSSSIEMIYDYKGETFRTLTSIKGT